MKPIDQQVVVITGASPGIGRCAALHLAGLGARLGLFARDGAALEELRAEIEGLGGEAVTVAGDAPADEGAEGAGGGRREPGVLHRRPARGAVLRRLVRGEARGGGLHPGGAVGAVGDWFLDRTGYFTLSDVPTDGDNLERPAPRPREIRGGWAPRRGWRGLRVRPIARAFPVLSKVAAGGVALLALGALRLR